MCARVYLYISSKTERERWRERKRAVISSFSLSLFPIDDDGVSLVVFDFFLTSVMMLFFREEIDPHASNESFVCSSRGREIIIGGDR